MRKKKVRVQEGPHLLRSATVSRTHPLGLSCLCGAGDFIFGLAYAFTILMKGR